MYLEQPTVPRLVYFYFVLTLLRAVTIVCVIGIRSLASSKKSSLLICFKLKGSEGLPSYFANEIALLQSLTSFLTELAVAGFHELWWKFESSVCCCLIIFQAQEFHQCTFLFILAAPFNHLRRRGITSKDLEKKMYDLFSTVTIKNLILEIRVPTHL